MTPLATLTPSQPYNFALLLELLRRYAHPTLDRVSGDAYLRALRLDSGMALVRVEATDSGELAIYHDAGNADPAEIIPTMRHILGADIAVAPFIAFARTEPALWRVVEPLVGIRWLRTASAFEALMITITEQQIAWTAAQRAQRWLVEWGRQSIDHDGETYFAFPTPAQIAIATVDDLTPLKITFRRMRLMIDIAGQVVAGDLDLERLLHTAPEDAYATLTAIKGIGHWTAAWTLARTQGTFAYVGHNDVALQAAVNHYFYGGTGRIPADQVTATFAPYGDFAGIAAHYTILRWVLDRYD